SLGALVAVLDRSAGEGIIECDVASSASVDDAVARAVDQLGGLTDLVCNAGMGRNQPMQTYSDKDWALVLGENLTGPFNCIESAPQTTSLRWSRSCAPMLRRTSRARTS